MFRLFIIVILFAPIALAITDQESLAEWTKNTEMQLINKYKIIESDWFTQNCLKLASTMQFKKLNSCQLLDSNKINAYVFDNGHVYFSLAMMQQIKNLHQWAAILAHENAHLELHHYIKMLKNIKKPSVFFPKSKIRKMLRLHEVQADQWSHEILNNYEFDYSQINYFLQRVKKLNNDEKNKKHLRLSKRIKKAKNIEIINKQLIEKIQQLKNRNT